MKLIDVACLNGHVTVDVFVEGGECPACECGAATERTWAFVKAPGRNTDRPAGPAKVDTKAIAAETKFEIEQKWQRYSDPQVAEQHVSREINEAAGIADAQGNKKPITMPAPITFKAETAAAS
jgi:hypothetical protein